MSFAAVRPGVDLSTHAMSLARVHDAVLGSGRTVLQPRPVVAKSWQRAMREGLNPHVSNARDPLSWEDTERRRLDSPLRLALDDLIHAVSGVADAAHFLLVVTDADGILLWRQGASAVRRRADTLGFSEGAEWTERRVGTNAIGTALVEQAPVQLFSAEHFEQGQHGWYCTAYPIHDPRDGQLLGIADISGPALTLHPAIEALVETAVRLAESKLLCHHELGLHRIRTSAEHVLSAITGPALVVDDHGWVASSRGMPRRDRVDVPHAEQTLAVPGLGVCVPERLREGWLLRPVASARTMRAVLRRDAVPTLTITSGDLPWTVTLSPRHAEILAILRRSGPRGLTSGALSRALYGDDQHQVTVRAEISRLRRTVGAFIATQPYRLAADVVLDLAE